MSQLAALFQQEVTLLDHLLELLGQEREVLTTGSPEELDEISRKKLDLLALIEQASQSRMQTLETLSAPASADKLPVWLANHPEQGTALQAWQMLIKLTADAKQAHDTNGLLLDALLRQTNDALAILTQYQQQHSLYGKDGQANASLGNRIVDSA